MKTIGIGTLPVAASLGAAACTAVFGQTYVRAA